MVIKYNIKTFLILRTLHINNKNCPVIAEQFLLLFKLRVYYFLAAEVAVLAAAAGVAVVAAPTGDLTVVVASSCFN